MKGAGGVYFGSPEGQRGDKRSREGWPEVGQVGCRLAPEALGWALGAPSTPGRTQSLDPGMAEIPSLL